MNSRNAIIALFVAMTIAVGFGSAFLAPVTQWYFDLNRPGFTPPPWLFAPVWTLLYLMIGAAGGLVWLKAPRSAAMWLWFAQLGLNGLWSIIFFRMRNLDLAVLVILALILVILAFIRTSWQPERLAALLFVPYALWVGFATLLNISFAALN
ncbi:MAG: TspO/MBR family protein [Rhizobiaceae bacterium]